MLKKLIQKVFLFVSDNPQNTITKLIEYHFDGSIKKIRKYENGELFLEVIFFENGSLKSLRLLDPDLPKNIVLSFDEEGASSRNKDNKESQVSAIS